MTESPKHRVLFIRHKPKQRQAEFLNVIEDGWGGALGIHCDLHVVDEDFDYGEACDRVNPDYVVLEDPGGYRPFPVEIRNVNARPDIPKIGLQIQDPHDTARPHFLRLLDHMKIERFFTLGVAPFCQSPEWAGRCFTLSQYIDDKIFRDYELEKIIPISVFGGIMTGGFYNWRAENATRMHDFFPTFLYTHPGYEREIPRYRFPVMGESYARMLNRSHFSLADPTREGYTVRKHLEIPASGAVLITAEASDVLCYGFRDMENCIMGTGVELFKKIAAVANDPALYERIRKNGHDLVHGRYTKAKWTWFHDWFECQRHLKPGETVQQQGVLGPFAGVPATENVPALLHDTLIDSDFATTMKQTMRLILENGDLAEAEARMRAVIGWLGHVNEPYLPLALIALLQGKTEDAKNHLLAASIIRNDREKTTCFDPEELAWLSLVGVLKNDPAFVATVATATPGIRHLSLRRMEVLIKNLRSGAKIEVTPELLTRQAGDRLSIHWTGQMEWTVWLDLVGRVLKAHRLSVWGASNDHKQGSA